MHRLFFVAHFAKWYVESALGAGSSSPPVYDRFRYLSVVFAWVEGVIFAFVSLSPCDEACNVPVWSREARMAGAFPPCLPGFSAVPICCSIVL